MNYGDATGFVSYHESRGNAIPGTWDNDSITAALLVASEWIDGVYGPSFVGYKTDGFNQEREWPRTTAVVESSTPVYIIGTTDIPTRVINATYEAAYRQMTTPGSLSVDYKPNKYKSVAVEGAIRVDYAGISSVADLQIQIAGIDTLLAPLLDCDSADFYSPLSGSSVRT